MTLPKGNKRHCNYRIVITRGLGSCCYDNMWLYRTEFILSFYLYYLNFTAIRFAETSPEDETIVSKRLIRIFWHVTMKYFLWRLKREVVLLT